MARRLTAPAIETARHSGGVQCAARNSTAPATVNCPVRRFRCLGPYPAQEQPNAASELNLGNLIHAADNLRAAAVSPGIADNFAVAQGRAEASMEK
jgi:hypothetical protein